MARHPPPDLREPWDDLAVLRAGIRFAQRVGRAPRRVDLRTPHREAWQKSLGIKLPTADMAASRFGSWSEYLRRMGYQPHAVGSFENQTVEQVGISHVEEAYPGIEIVQAEQNAWDAVHQFSEGGRLEKVEIKAASLSQRGDSLGVQGLYWGFKTHSRTLSKTVDRLILVGVGQDPKSQEAVLLPLMRMEFVRSSLPMVDGKSTIMVYATSVFGPSHSIYRPFVRWRRPGVSMIELPLYLRVKDEEGRP